MLEDIFKFKKYDGTNKVVFVIRIIITFLTVNFTWILFRSNNLQEFIYIVKNMGISLDVAGALFELGTGLVVCIFWFY